MPLEEAPYVLLVHCEWSLLLCCCVAKLTGMTGMLFNTPQVFATGQQLDEWTTNTGSHWCTSRPYSYYWEERTTVWKVRSLLWTMTAFGGGGRGSLSIKKEESFHIIERKHCLCEYAWTLQEKSLYIRLCCRRREPGCGKSEPAAICITYVLCNIQHEGCALDCILPVGANGHVSV